VWPFTKHTIVTYVKYQPSQVFVFVHGSLYEERKQLNTTMDKEIRYDNYKLCVVTWNAF